MYEKAKLFGIVRKETSCNKEGLGNEENNKGSLWKETVIYQINSNILSQIEKEGEKTENIIWRRVEMAECCNVADIFFLRISIL